MKNKSIQFARAVVLICLLASLAQAKLANEGTCGEYGTSVAFAESPLAAAAQAAQEEKLVFVLHVSGLFEKPDYT